MSAVVELAMPSGHGGQAQTNDDVVSVHALLMGGQVGVYLRPVHPPAMDASTRRLDLARRDAARTIRRIAAWSNRLTRFTTTSELSRLNGDPEGVVRVGPTMAAVLRLAREAQQMSDGIVDPTLLDARLAAEDPAFASNVVAHRFTPVDRKWAVESLRRGATVTRNPGVRFDFGGIAKGWIADRAASALEANGSVLVDADGDLAAVLPYGAAWRIGVADPRTHGQLAALQIVGLDPSRSQRLGVATSGTSIHRWSPDGQRPSHHLIDPRTGQPAVTDVVQATVLADTASAAEIYAKTIVILGSEAGATIMERPGVRAVIILDDRDQVLASPSTLRWLA